MNKNIESYLKGSVSHLGSAGVQANGGGLEGAARTTRETFSWQPAIIAPDDQAFVSKDLADARSLDMVQNDGYATGAVSIHRDSIVGSQYRLNSKPNIRVLGVDEAWAEEFQLEAESRFNLVADSPSCWLDASRRSTFTGMVRQAIGMFVIHGEVLSVAEWINQTDRPFNTAIQMISPFRLSNPNMEMNTPNLRNGIHIDNYGRPLNYYIRKNFPNAMFDLERDIWRRVPAEKPWGRKQVIHIVEQLLPAQNRGVSEMVAALKQMRMTKKFQEVALQNAIVQASYAAAIESELPTDVVYHQMGMGQQTFQDQINGFMEDMASYYDKAKNVSIDGVKIPHLFPQTKLKLQPLGTPGGVGSDFEESLLRHTAAALGLSYEQFSRDYTKTNYSSARASMSETWKYMNARKKIVADNFATTVYTLWLEEEINKGNLPLPPGKTADWFYEPMVKDALSSCQWIGASRGQIDEKKETEAAGMRLSLNMTTLEDETARLGGDWREVLEQRAREQRFAKKLGLTEPQENGKIQSDDKQSDDDDDDKSDNKAQQDDK